jgi:predicted transposase YbfD/YdcC
VKIPDTSLSWMVEIFESLPDPRVERTKRHPLSSVMVLALFAVICGCEGWDDMARFSAMKRAWLETWLDLPNGTPSADTFRRVIAMLDPAEFHRCFVAWMSALAGGTKDKLVSIDGKTVRGTLRSALGKSALHLVSAWCAENSVVLGQVATAEKSNEITAIPELLALLDLSGATVTIDAMGCQKKIAEAIVAKSADYILALKGNQSTLEHEVQDFFAVARKNDFLDVAHSFHETVDADHGRVEVRRTWATCDTDWMLDAKKDWKGLRTLIRVENECTKDGKTTVDHRHYISSHTTADAEHLGKLVRGHWGIESALHWVLDVTFREDSCRIHDGHAAENFALLRKIALALFKQETSTKTSVALKKKSAGWDHTYGLKVLAAGFPEK